MMHLHLLPGFFFEEKHSRDLHDDVRAQEIIVGASISQSFDVVVNNKSHSIHCYLPSMVFRYTLYSFLV